MKNSFCLIALLFGLNVLFIGCDEPNQQTTSQTNASPSKMSDSDLENAVRAKFEGDPKLKDAKLDVDADADKNEITISGTVSSQDMRTKAIEMARSAQSGITINDKIDVKPAG